MPPDSIRMLSIGVLKSILFTNHVNVANILEKGDLVNKVIALVEDEKRERERMRLVGEMEEMERVQREMEREGVDVSPPSSTERDGAGSSQQGERAVSPEGERRKHPSDPVPDTSGHERTEFNPAGGQRPDTNTTKPPLASAMERNGLCVVCQDEEANIAIVDCGFVDVIPLITANVLTHYSLIFPDTWRCADPAPTSSCLPRKNVPCVERESLQRRDC